ALDEVDPHALERRGGLLVDEHGDPGDFDDAVGRGPLGGVDEREPVEEPSRPPAADAEPERQVGLALPLHEVADLVAGEVGDRDPARLPGACAARASLWGRTSASIRSRARRSDASTAAGPAARANTKPR